MPSPTLTDILKAELAGRVPLSARQMELLESHYSLLLRWNVRMSLTTVTHLPEAATRHYCESLMLASRLGGVTVADVGSGAGFPGIPAAVLRPDIRFDLVESNQKKCVFLKEASRALPNIRVVAARAESLAGPYDCISARAVDPQSVMALPYSSKFALLVGMEDAAQLSGSARCSINIEPLPWGDRRVIALVTRST